MNDAMQSLPLGNGDIGTNVWLSSDGNIHLLVSKTDTWSELYRLQKPAYLVLKTNPPLFANGADFDLNIAEGFLMFRGETALCVYTLTHLLRVFAFH